MNASCFETVTDKQLFRVGTCFLSHGRLYYEGDLVSETDLGEAINAFLKRGFLSPVGMHHRSCLALARSLWCKMVSWKR
ncbi:MAG: hypothetical protein ACAH95_04610 [Fimbriimonas sp.]